MLSIWQNFSLVFKATFFLEMNTFSEEFSLLKITQIKQVWNFVIAIGSTCFICQLTSSSLLKFYNFLTHKCTKCLYWAVLTVVSVLGREEG